ncbi:N-acetylglucosamine-6-phosphate deacetylase [Agromyces cerinus]|uniref:N-acetylglucosamine 6-phosphate deacetylase n=1 Tax=Agromyces cerinus subsp. cerinus TaxID=232089 RepID=A0A1N6FIM1_9MICO|nr:N-acetylglucosamine-6-phosphate deacetylase [Agromyces cerinus]SIN95138.1 N-acetylglucosamine 6-phosphate deacetylase [Agromyces cerinus subsp. cerinus]
MSTPPVIIHSARLVSGADTVTDAWVRFDGDQVTERGIGDGWRDGIAVEQATVTDAAGRFLTPGFIDIHCHGAGGAAVDEGDAAIETVLAVHNAHGTTRSVLSLVTASVDRLTRDLTTIARFAERDPRVLGSHLEGPFLDTEFRGAHDPSLLRDADEASVDLLLEAAAGTLRQITIAPEHDGALDAISRFVAADVRVAVGHTGADFETALAAFDAGASILTHAFNGMRGIHHRAPGPVTAAMHADHVTLEVINDGVHVHPDVVKLAFSGAPGRVALVTDAMAATGSADGVYELGSLEVVVTDGVARLREGGSIAGSTLTQDEALRRAVLECGIPLDEAVGALTVTPAAAIGRAGDLGRLQPGFAADAVLLDADLRVQAVWGAGSRLA